MPEMNEEVISRNFIENEIDKDLQEGVSWNFPSENRLRFY